MIKTYATNTMKTIQKNKQEKNPYKHAKDAINGEKLYFRKTDTGAEYLCRKPVTGTETGDLATAIVRLK